MNNKMDQRGGVRLEEKEMGLEGCVLGVEGVELIRLIKLIFYIKEWMED